jgi:carboxylate-amine ligase
MLLLACGTHPSAVWSRQRATDASRYDKLMRDLQMLGSRNQLCGLHVHVEVQDEDERMRLMVRILPSCRCCWRSRRRRPSGRDSAPA